MSREECTVKLGDFIETVDPAPSSPCGEGEGVEECVERLRSMAPFFGENFAAPNKKRIITRWGEIMLNDDVFSPNKDAEYVLGLGGDKVSRSAMLVVYGRDDVDVSWLENGNYRLFRLGENYLWYDYMEKCYVWKNLNYLNVDVPFFIWNGMLILGKTTRISKNSLEKLFRGDGDFHINYVIPGVPDDVRFFNIQMVGVGRKVMKIVWEKGECGIIATIPYFDGLYRLFVPYDAGFDPWSPNFLKEIDQKYVVEEVFSTGFTEVPEDAQLEWKFTPFVSTFTIMWENGRKRVRVHLIEDRISKLCVSNGSAEKCTKDLDVIYGLLSLPSPGAVFAAVGLM